MSISTAKNTDKKAPKVMALSLDRETLRELTDSEAESGEAGHSVASHSPIHCWSLVTYRCRTLGCKTKV
jgi:hypothetical protein